MRQWWVCKLQIIPLILRFLDDALFAWYIFWSNSCEMH
jgi:hypothetical protein